MLWKLYYPNTTFTSEDGEWSSAPARGVQALAVPHHSRTRQIQTNDFYFWPEWFDQPMAGDVFGLVDWLLESGRMGDTQHILEFTPNQLFSWGVKWGRSLTNETYGRLRQQIVEDADLIVWGAKAGRLPNERP